MKQITLSEGKSLLAAWAPDFLLVRLLFLIKKIEQTFLKSDNLILQFMQK